MNADILKRYISALFLFLLPMTNLIFLSRKPSIKDSILNQTQNVNPAILNELESLITKYQLTWIPDNKGEGGRFLGKELSVAKGNDSRDFAKHWDALQAKTDWNQYPIAPEVIKLTGDDLKAFKTLFQHYTGTSLGSINSLYVVNWVAAYGYLVQGYSQAAQEFTSLGARAVVNQPSPVAKDVVVPINVVPNNVVPLVKEEVLQDQLCLLSMEGTLNFKREVVIADTLRSGGKTRRYDLVQHEGDRTIIYELKRATITLQDVMMTIGDKGYLTLAEQSPKFADKELSLVFVSPGGIEPAAARMLQQMPKVTFVSLQELALRLLWNALSEIKKECPGQVGWYMKEKFLPKYSAILPQDCSRLLQAA